jgi:hypothetical protein
MGARVITRSRLKEQARLHGRLKEQMKIRPQSISLTVIQDENTKAVLGVSIDREAAARMCAAEGWTTAEILDFPLGI